MTSPQTRHNTTWMNRQKEKGLCLFCKEKSLPDSFLCETHFFKSVATSTFKNREMWEGLRTLFYAQESRCYLSGIDLILGKNASLDHIIPLSKGGNQNIDNVRWCDKSVNVSKRAMSNEDFITMCRNIVNHLESKAAQ